MATRDTAQQGGGISRRDFLKATAATAAVGCGLEFAYDPEKALAYESSADYKVSYTTCPYCSASCGQRVVTNRTTGEVVDIYGDFESPWNSGGLCAKGAGSFELATNKRRIGAYAGAHPTGIAAFEYDPAFTNGVAYRREGDGDWSKVALSDAYTEIATGMIAARNSDTAGWDPAAGKYNSKGIAFFGSSHMNNEPNYVYRKLIANFGTSNVEHQARI